MAISVTTLTRQGAGFLKISLAEGNLLAEFELYINLSAVYGKT